MRPFILTVFLALIVIAVPAAAQSDRDRQDALKHLRLGQENLRAEMWDKAEAEFAQAIKLDPQLELAHYGLGQVYMATRRYPMAVTAYTRCRDVTIENRSQQAAGRVASEQRVVDELQQLETERSLVTSGKYAVRDPNAVLARLDMVIHDLRDRRYQQPSAAPQTPPYISVALGSAYFRSGALADAEREYRDAIGVDPKIGEAHNNLAVVCMLTGRYDEADAEIAAAEKSGFKVNPQLKADLKARRAKPKT